MYYAHAVKQVWEGTQGSWHYGRMEQCIPHGQNSPRSSTALHSGAYCNKRTVISCRLLLDPQRAESRQTDKRDETKPEAWERQIESRNQTGVKLRFQQPQQSETVFKFRNSAKRRKIKEKEQKNDDDDDHHHHHHFFKVNFSEAFQFFLTSFVSLQRKLKKKT